MDDVIGWLISVAKKRGIPVEDMNMHRFATCTGPLLTLMNQQNFIDRDPTYGAVLYSEFRKLMGGKVSNVKNLLLFSMFLFCRRCEQFLGRLDTHAQR